MYEYFVMTNFHKFCKKAAGKDGSFLKHEHSDYQNNACISYQSLRASLKVPESTVQYNTSTQKTHV